jgi:hypothetical protein
MFDLKGLLAVVSAGAMMAVCANDPVLEITTRLWIGSSLWRRPVVRGDTSVSGSRLEAVALSKAAKAPVYLPHGRIDLDLDSPDGSSSISLKKRSGAKPLRFLLSKELNGKYFEFCLYIDRAAFDFPKESLPIGAFEKPIEVQTLSGLLGLDPSGSVGGKWYLDDFRDVAWSKSFRIRFSGLYDPASGAKGCAVLSLKASPGVSKAFVQLPLNKETSRASGRPSLSAGRPSQENDSADAEGQLLCAGAPRCDGRPFF